MGNQALGTKSLIFDIISFYMEVTRNSTQTKKDSSIVLVIMGVSASGKTQTSLALHKALLEKGYSTQFIDADTLHSSENLLKMRSSIPLTDMDRQPWLESCKEVIRSWIFNKNTGFVGIFACSALKRK
jgi:carbohydrate kinase (thermoresistant glucokinase family)